MKPTILVIEDNADVRDNMKELLSLAGYNVISSANGKQGLEMILKDKPDLILCDIMMPELDGYGVLRALSNNPEVSSIPFVYMTAKTRRSDFRKGMDLGADDYLTKPYTGDELIRIVRSQLAKRQALKSSLQVQEMEFNEESANPMNPDHGIHSLLENRPVKKLKKKSHLFTEGDHTHYLYYVSSGKAKCYKTNDAGKDYIVGINKEGDFIGLTALFDRGIYKESCVTLEDSEIIMIPSQEFFDILKTNCRLLIEFTKMISLDLSDAEDKLLNLAYNSARKRVAEALLFMSRKYLNGTSGTILFQLQRENISAIAGISPESVSRNLSDFKDEGLISTDNGHITILDIKKLEDMKN